MYEREKIEIRTLRSYLLSQIPTTPLPPNGMLLSSKSSALAAAISGLDKEGRRLEREERLVEKFTAAASHAAGGAGARAGPAGGEDDVADMEYVKMTREDASPEMAGTDSRDVAMDDDTKDEEEWEEAAAVVVGTPSPALKHDARQDDEAASTADQKEEEDDNREFCRRLASSAVARIARDDVRVGTPLGALGLALHAALAEIHEDDETGSGSGGGERPALFRCTGVPDAGIASKLLGEGAKPSKKKTGGRSPRSRVAEGGACPAEVEEGASPSSSNGGGGAVVAFRYKCGSGVYSVDSGHANDATTVYLALRLSVGEGDDDDEVVSMSFGALPAGDGSAEEEEQRPLLKFPLGRHVNLDGFRAARAKIGGGGGTLVSPSLFYVSLSELFLEFSSTFRVLPRKKKSATGKGEEGASVPSEVMSVAKIDTSGTEFRHPVPMRSLQKGPIDATHRPVIPPDGAAVDMPFHMDSLRVMNSQRGDKRKDFEGDLIPGGPRPGGLHDVPSRGAGSQVGPDHPMFDRTFGDDDYYGHGGADDDFGGGFGGGGGGFGVPGIGGGMGMRPRFDPYGPPGGPTDPGRGGRFPGRGSRLGRGRGGRGGGRNGRVPPGGFGNPNPDHMTPPGGGYFS
eukprot:CAMPEP_0181082132 /NCGR_PEP_ID=MMETSP1071-20121207/3461_1 /TAXON_ID=35127 /ORGANISM="Thalassiosira sp., Strain NH16" /LENGTH=625 /DNA_ID=CAMNT_0023163703 /DNA_START=148 /DNA_END=2026 /DNA_ORIENTATION=-